MNAMTHATHAQDAVRLQLIIDRKWHHDLTDQLLTYHPAVPFHLYEVKSYHSQQTLQGTDEKVSGYQVKMVLDIQTSLADYPKLLAYLKQATPKISLHYEVIPCVKRDMI